MLRGHADGLQAGPDQRLLVMRGDGDRDHRNCSRCAIEEPAIHALQQEICILVAAQGIARQHLIERLMHLLRTAHRAFERMPPVAGHQATLRRQRCGEQGDGALECGGVEVITDFAEDDQVELTGWPVGRMVGLLQRDAGVLLHALAGQLDGVMGEIGCQQAGAACAELCAELAIGAAELPAAVDQGKGQGGQ